MNRVLVFGDVFLDSYLRGVATRVSPEAPVPVLAATGREHRLGGAANVAANVAALGGEAIAVFALGADESAGTVRSELVSCGVDVSRSVELGDAHTIVKERVVAGAQQLVRIDYNDYVPLDDAGEEALFSAISEAMESVDLAVVSDYGKGTCTERLCRGLIEIAKEPGVPVIVDPKGRGWSKYRGASVITPNLRELNLYSGKEVANDAEAIASEYGSCPAKLDIPNLLLTRSEKGMSLIDENGIVNIEARRREVFDVSGAGDTVVAALACELRPDMSNLLHAVSVANAAAGVAVGKHGTAVVSRAELDGELAGNVSAAEAKIYGTDDRERLLADVSRWRRGGLKLVATSGCFDILHRGHAYLLARAAELGDRLVIFLNADASVRRLKGAGRPVNGELDRAFVLASLENVDAVALFDPATDPESRGCASEAPMALAELVRPDVYVKGGDYAHDQVPEAKFAGRFVAARYLEGYSTTEVVERCG